MMQCSEDNLDFSSCHCQFQNLTIDTDKQRFLTTLSANELAKLAWGQSTTRRVVNSQRMWLVRDSSIDFQAFVAFCKLATVWQLGQPPSWLHNDRTREIARRLWAIYRSSCIASFGSTCWNFSTLVEWDIQTRPMGEFACKNLLVSQNCDKADILLFCNCCDIYTVIQIQCSFQNETWLTTSFHCWDRHCRCCCWANSTQQMILFTCYLMK